MLLSTLRPAAASALLKHGAVLRPAAFMARGFAFSSDPGTEGSTESRRSPERLAADEEKKHMMTPEEIDAATPPQNPSVDSMRHMMGKVNEAAGGGYDFPKTGGETVRAMGSEVADNATDPLARFASASGDAAVGVFTSTVDSVKGAGQKIADAARSMMGGARDAVSDATDRGRTEGSGGGHHTLGDHMKGTDSQRMPGADYQPHEGSDAKGADASRGGHVGEDESAASAKLDDEKVGGGMQGRGSGGVDGRTATP